MFLFYMVLFHICKKLLCAFVDFTKAFDYVVRDNLWLKLVKLGIRGKMLNMFVTFSFSMFLNDIEDVSLKMDFMV